MSKLFYLAATVSLLACSPKGTSPGEPLKEEIATPPVRPINDCEVHSGSCDSNSCADRGRVASSLTCYRDGVAQPGLYCCVMPPTPVLE